MMPGDGILRRISEPEPVPPERRVRTAAGIRPLRLGETEGIDQVLLFSKREPPRVYARYLPCSNKR